MITDKIENYAKYSHLAPRIVKALEYLGSTDFTHVENGQSELDGRRLVSIVMRYKTKTAENAVWESHRKHIDVQFMAAGRERFGHVTLTEAPPARVDYDETKDVILYQPGTNTYDAPQGTFMIFYPEDVHAPSLAVGVPPVPGEVVKVVVKVAVED